jgi:hypothetical protein
MHIVTDHFICKEQERCISILAISMKKMQGLYVGNVCIRPVDLLLHFMNMAYEHSVYISRNIVRHHTEVWLCGNKSKEVSKAREFFLGCVLLR